jgi:hypothetical protein
MALDWQLVRVELLGLSQHDDSRKRPVGTLERATNVEVVKAGKLTIRRGFRRVHADQAVDNVALRTDGQMLFDRIACFDGGVVVMAKSKLLAIVSRLNEITVSGGGSTGVVDHGGLAGCGIRSHVVATGERSTGEGIESGE